MTRIVNLRFREAGKVFKYSCDDLTLKVGDSVMAETNMGLELGVVTEPPCEMELKEGESYPPVQRMADQSELERAELKKVKEQEAYELCLSLIEKHGLDMNLIDAEFSFDGKKIIFYFTSDNRVDFRELVKDLASSFKARIELRQIGSRDQAKLVGGLGVCGRELCCCTFLNHFAPVTVRMARDQGMSLNPTKLNGSCGRLMCCLQFEKDAYSDARRRLPKQGKKIRTPRGMGVVADVNLIEETVNVKFTVDDMSEVEKFDWAALEPLNPEMSQGCEEQNCSSCPGCPDKGDKKNN